MDGGSQVVNFSVFIFSDEDLILEVSESSSHVEGKVKLRVDVLRNTSLHILIQI